MAVGLGQQALLKLGPAKAHRGAEVEPSIEAIIGNPQGNAGQRLHPQGRRGKGQPTLALRRGARPKNEPSELRGQAKAGQGRNEGMHEP